MASPLVRPFYILNCNGEDLQRETDGTEANETFLCCALVSNFNSKYTSFLCRANTGG